MSNALAERAHALGALPAEAWSLIDRAALEGRTLFLTGGTGFVGRWLLAAIAHLNTTATRPLRVRALTRGVPPFDAPWLTWVAGDVRDFTDVAPAELLVHAALPSTATPAGGEQALRETARSGMERVLEHATRAGVVRSMVLSSGAVYGAVKGSMVESAPLGALAPGDAYAEAKREVEALALAETRAGHDMLIVRLFTCIGEGYRAHGHLAHVALIAEARAGLPLTLRGDGTAVRSYLAGEDLGLWLLVLLSREGNDIVNVGSDRAMSVREFAELVAVRAGLGADAVRLGDAPAGPRAHFVPDLTHARARYGLAPWTPVERVIDRLLRTTAVA